VIEITMSQTIQGRAYEEALTIDAATGTPIRFAGGGNLDNPDIAITYDVARVKAADFGQ
jgi:hypothetical protein